MQCRTLEPVSITVTLSEWYCLPKPNNTPTGYIYISGFNFLLDPVEIVLTFQGRSTKVITGPIILMSRVFPWW